MKKLNSYLLCLFIFISGFSPLFSEGEKYHGGDCVFEVEDIGVFWGMLKSETIDSSKVYLNIVPIDFENLKFTRYSVIASNVFTNEEKTLVDFKTLNEQNMIIQDYGDFNLMSKRRILFFTSDNSKNDPAMEIYYAGFPDTTPVFLQEDQIQGFFDHSVMILKSKKSK